MTHSYAISGMTCAGCQAKVQSLLSKVPGVIRVDIDLGKGEAIIDMDTHLSTGLLKAALIEHPKYGLESVSHQQVAAPAFEQTEIKSWVETYKPILLIFAYITGISLLVENLNSDFAWMRWMGNFMAGFFLIFSFFKFLNLKGFAESYAMYDIVAKRWSGWGYVYVFIELALGLAFVTRFNPLLTNIVTFTVMAVSIIGVLQSVLNRRKIKCACLGDVFNLPMSTITIIEDGLMIAMSALMIIKMW